MLDDEEELGCGGMAVVRVALDRELGRRIAYHQLEAELMDNDLASLGACLYEILTGTSPHGGHGESTVEIVTQALQCEIVAPQDRVDVDLPAQLSRVAMKAIRPTTATCWSSETPM